MARNFSAPEPEQSETGSEESFGFVISVTGARASVAVPTRQHSSGSDDPISVGKLISIRVSDRRVIGLVYSAAAANPGVARSDGELSVLQVELVGQITSSSGREIFERGIQIYPAVGAPAYPTGPNDLSIIYDYSGEETIVIGRLGQDPRLEATVRVKDLLQKHFAVLGTTGSGKSTAVSLILNQVLKTDQDLRILLIDPHNEFTDAFGDKAEIVSPKNLQLPFWLFNFEEITDVIYRRRPGVEEELDALADLIPMAKARYASKGERVSVLVKRENDDGGFTVDSPVPYRMSDVVAIIDEQLGKLEGRDDRPKLRRLRARISSVMNDSRYQFMFSNRTIEDTMGELLKTLFRIPMNGKPVTIIELAGFTSDVVDAVVSVLCRLAFELGVWGGGRVPLVVVAEEAHRYVPADRRLGFGPTRRAISRIAKEGRKYGVYLGVITQRPSELDPTILSQCSTIFAMRLSNEADHAIIRSAVSDAATSTLEALPSMGNREALAFGEAVSMPMRVRFTNVPRAELPSSIMQEQRGDGIGSPDEFVDDLVRRWRALEQRGR